MTDAPVGKVDETNPRLAKTWLGFQDLRRLLNKLDFSGDERKLIINAVEAIGLSARIERGAHHENKLAAMDFHPLSPRARHGLPPDISLGQVAEVLDDNECYNLVQEHFPTKFPSTAVAPLMEFVRRFEATPT